MGNKIVSISLNDRLLDEINRLQKSLGFSGRSELIRAGLKMLIIDKKEKENLSGIISGVLVIVHKEDSESEITKYKHVFNNIIKTHVHTNMDKKCMDLLALVGDAKEVKALTESMQSIKKIDYVKLVVS